MKKCIAVVTVLMLIFSLCACDVAGGGASTPKGLLCSEKWRNVNDGDFYQFNSDGTGLHESAETTYTIEGNKVTVVEGASSVVGKTFTLDQSTSVVKLIPEDKSTYYVLESKYEEVGAKVREENIAILLETEEFRNAIGTTFNYLAFMENGQGWFITMQTGTCSMNWEVIDNNTIKCSVTVNGVTNTITLDIIGNNGSPQLVNTKGEVAYIPYTGS